MVLFLTRHGETDYNLVGRYCGSIDAPLNGRGEAQARDLAARLAAEGAQFDAVISSPLLRARQTADIVCAALGMDYEIFHEFAERNMGVFEGQTAEENREKYPEMWARHCSPTPDCAPDGGESARQMCARIDGGIARLREMHVGRRVLLIAHGYAGRAIHRHIHNLDFLEMAGYVLGNCEIAEYRL